MGAANPGAGCADLRDEHDLAAACGACNAGGHPG